MAEWLRRLTRNQFPSGSVGSNPTDCEVFIFIFLKIKKLLIVKNLKAIDTQGIVGSVVECSPATRAARVRFPDDAEVILDRKSPIEGFSCKNSYMMTYRMVRLDLSV